MKDSRKFLISMMGLSAIAKSSFAGHVNFRDEVNNDSTVKLSIPKKWERAGIVISRSFEGPGSNVVGDPCIVRDEDSKGWRMFLFYDQPGCGHAIYPMGASHTPGHWKLEGAIQFTNPEALLGNSTHKLFIVMDAYQPNKAAKINGYYHLLSVSFRDGHKLVQESTSEKLSGPWTVIPEALIPNGIGNDFDAKHADAVTGFYFPDKDETLYFYMGYPQQKQLRPYSPWGNAQGVTVRKTGEKNIQKLFVIKLTNAL